MTQMNQAAAESTREQVIKSARSIAAMMPDDTLAYVLSYVGTGQDDDVTRAILDAAQEEYAKRVEEKRARQESEKARWSRMGVTRHGIQYEKGDGAAGWTAWAVFPASVPDDEALERLGWESVHARYPGDGYAHSAYVRRRSRTRVLITQDGGLDI